MSLRLRGGTGLGSGAYGDQLIGEIPRHQEDIGCGSSWQYTLFPNTCAFELNQRNCTLDSPTVNFNILELLSVQKHC